MKKLLLNIETLPVRARRGLRWLRVASGGSLRRAALTYLTLLVFAVQAATPPAGTSVGNQASATYTDASNTPRQSTSNVAVTQVDQVASFTLTANGAKFATPGGQVYYPHTLINTGNGVDTFNLSVANNGADNFDLNSVALYADANGDGLPDNNTAIITTGPLVAGAIFKFVALGIVPGSASAAQVAGITVTASGTATAAPAPAQNNVDTITITADAVVNVTKAMNASSGAAGSGPHTITLTYNNTGNNTATNITIMDILPAGMTYVAGSARWGVTGTTPLTDATGDNQGTAPDTINYDFGITVAGRVTAVIARVQPGQSGTMTFQVNIGAAQGSGVINNTATYTYDPGTGTPVGPFNGNTFAFTVTQGAGVALTGATVASASQGSTVVFTNVVQNTGNGTDRFDIMVTNTSFPAGSTFTLYQGDGNTPLVDTSGNGTPDTGPLAVNATYSVILKVVLPTGASGAGPYTAQKTARSTVDPTKTASANDTLNAIAANSVDLSNGAIGGAGAGPEGSPVVVNTANPGVTTRFTLYVTNTSSVADTYNLATSTASSFATLGLPAGWSVTLRDTSEAVVTATGVILAGGYKVIYADVTLPAGATPGTTDVYFRALSPTSGASDRIHDAVSVNTVRSLALTPNNNGQVVAGGFVVYNHLLANNGNVLEGAGSGSTINLTVADNQSGWSSVIYYDANNNGQIDPSENIVTDLSFVSAAGAGLAPGETVRLIVKVAAPAGVPSGTIDVATLTATTVNGAYVTTVPAVVTATDTSTVISGDLQLLKEQALDSDLNGTADTAYGAADINSGAFPGKSIRYRITITNNGQAPATSVKVFDTTPVYTTYTTTGPAATTIGSVTTVPANGAAGSLEFNIGTLNPGQSAVVTFGVIINP